MPLMRSNSGEHWINGFKRERINSLSAKWLRFWELFGYDTQPPSCTAKLNAFVLSTFLPAIAINNGPPLFLPPAIEFRQFSLQLHQNSREVYSVVGSSAVLRKQLKWKCFRRSRLTIPDFICLHTTLRSGTNRGVMWILINSNYKQKVIGRS